MPRTHAGKTDHHTARQPPQCTQQRTQTSARTDHRASMQRFRTLGGYDTPRLPAENSPKPMHGQGAAHPRREIGPLHRPAAPRGSTARRQHYATLQHRAEEKEKPLRGGACYSQNAQHRECERLLALVASLTQQFAVLLLAHPLAALLDDRTHLSLRSCGSRCQLAQVYYQTRTHETNRQNFSEYLLPAATITWRKRGAGARRRIGSASHAIRPAMQSTQQMHRPCSEAAPMPQIRCKPRIAAVPASP